MNNKGTKLLFVSLLSLGIINCGGGGSDSSPDQEPVNQKPTANAGADQTVDEQATVTIEGSGSDSDGTIASYSWAQTSGPEITLSTTNQQTLEFTAPVAKQVTNLEFTLTVTDNDGATDSDSVIVTVNPVDEQKVTLKGVVTDGPIANAQVTAELGGRTYTSTADENGNYSLVLGADEDENLGELLVILTADGVGEQSYIRLKSVVDSFGNLLEQAGDDRILTADENNGVNVTHFSTAILGLIAIEKGEEYLSNKSSYESAFYALDGGRVVSIATSIKMIVDFSVEYPEFALPQGIEDTWQFATNKVALGSYASEITPELENLWQEVKESQFEDKNLYEKHISVPNMYTEVNNKFDTFTRYNFNDAGSSGTMNFREVEQLFVGSNFESKISLQLEGDVVSQLNINKWYMGQEYYVTQEEVWTNIEIQLIKSSNFADLVAIKTVGKYQVEPSPYYAFDDEPFTKYEVKLFAKNRLPIFQEDVLGQRVLSILSSNLDRVETFETIYGTQYKNIYENALAFNFLESGVVESSSGVLTSGTWNLSNGVLNMYFGNTRLIVNKIATNQWTVAAYDDSGQSLGFTAGNSAKRVAPNTNEQNAMGIYHSATLNLGESYYWFEVQEGNVGYQLSGEDTNGNGILDIGEYYRTPFVWEIVDSKLQLDFYKNLANEDCEVDFSECYLSRRRYFDLFEQVGDKQYSIYKILYGELPKWYQDLTSELSEKWVMDVSLSRYWFKPSELPIPVNFE